MKEAGRSGGHEKDGFSAFCDAAIRHRSKDRAENRRNPEEPELADRPSAGEERNARASRGVDGRIGHGNADEVDQRQRKTDGERRKACRRAFVGRAEDDDKEEHRHDDLGDRGGNKVISTG